MPDDLLTLAADAEAAAAALVSSDEDSTAYTHADRAIQHLRDSAQQLSGIAAALSGEQNESEPPAGPPAAIRDQQSRALTGVQ